MNTQLDIEIVKDFIIWWNNNYPLDYWWRKKHKISFNSKKHRKVNPIDIKFEFEEERLYQYYGRLREIKEKDLNSYLFTGRWLKKQVDGLNEEELGEFYEQLDLSQFDDK